MVLSFGNVCLLLFLTALQNHIICYLNDKERDRYYFYAFALSLLEVAYFYPLGHQ